LTPPAEARRAGLAVPELDGLPTDPQPRSEVRFRLRAVGGSAGPEKGQGDVADEGDRLRLGTREAGTVVPVRDLRAGMDDLSFHPEAGRPTDDAARARMRAAMAAIRRDLGFESATLFVPGGDGWQVFERDGATRPWHALLDPALLEGADEAAAYPDVRDLPGFGIRLAGLGCASVAILPVPDGGRLLLDSGTPSREDGWIERARPYLALIGLMAGPAWTEGGALRNHEEVAALDRVFAVCQGALNSSRATFESLLGDVREALKADELFLISERGAHTEVLASPEGPSRSLPGRVGLDRADQPGIGFDAEGAAQLALAVGASSRALAGAFGRLEEPVEALLAGWAEGPALSSVTMTVVARTVSTARSALEGRSRAVSSLMDRERTKMADALHDGLTQTVAGAVLQLEALRKRIEHDPADAVSVLENSKTEIRRALAELRGLLFDLHHGMEEETAPAEPLTQYVQDVVKRWRLPARVAVEGDLGKVPGRVLSVAYIVIREALANAAKHAAGHNVTVTLAATETELVVMVGDTGQGFTTQKEAAARGAYHFGLDMLRRRVAEVGGRIQIDSRAGRGTRVVARLPYEGAQS
jgi:signal transduction histidine kinase